MPIKSWVPELEEQALAQAVNLSNLPFAIRHVALMPDAHADLIISALSCQGNPVHRDEARAAREDRVLRDTVRLAERLGVKVVNVFAGCPGDGRGSRTPVWQVYTWPEEHAEVLRWQWEEVVIPYGREAASFATDHGIQLGFEMHPNFVVYNPPTWRRLRDAVGEGVAINLDPSHLFWR